MKNKEELIERVNELTSDNDLEYYILISDKGVSINGSRVHVCTLITSLLNYCIEKDVLKEKDIDKICELGKMNRKEIRKELLKSIQSAIESGNTELVEEIINDLEEEIK